MTSTSTIVEISEMQYAPNIPLAIVIQNMKDSEEKHNDIVIEEAVQHPNFQIDIRDIRQTNYDWNKDLYCFFIQMCCGSLLYIALSYGIGIGTVFIVESQEKFPLERVESHFVYFLFGLIEVTGLISICACCYHAGKKIEER